MTLSPCFCDGCGINLWENPEVRQTGLTRTPDRATVTVTLTCDCGRTSPPLTVDATAHQGWVFTRLVRAGSAAAQAMAASLDPMRAMTDALRRTVEDILTASQVPILKVPLRQALGAQPPRPGGIVDLTSVS